MPRGNIHTNKFYNADFIEFINRGSVDFSQRVSGRKVNMIKSATLGEDRRKRFGSNLLISKG